MRLWPFAIGAVAVHILLAIPLLFFSIAKEEASVVMRKGRSAVKVGLMPQLPTQSVAEQKPEPRKKKQLQETAEEKAEPSLEPQKHEASGDGGVIAADYAEGNTIPNYPRLAMRRGWEGKITLRFVIEVDGSCSSVSIVKSTGYKVLDREALRWARKEARFVAGKKNGKAVRSEMERTIVFVLNGTVIVG